MTWRSCRPAGPDDVGEPEGIALVTRPAGVAVAIAAGFDDVGMDQIRSQGRGDCRRTEVVLMIVAKDFQRQGYRTEVGSFSTDHEENTIVCEAGAKGFALFGPYLRLGKGTYKVEFSLNTIELGNKAAGRADVCARNGELILIEKGFSADQVGEKGVISLDFELSSTECVEFRIYSYGIYRLSLLGPPSLSILDDEFRFKNFAVSRSRMMLMSNRACEEALLKIGAAFEFSEDSVIVTVRGVKIEVSHAEDLQLITEIFLNNEYGIELNGDLTVIDVGMNVGIASLYFASMSTVGEVHSFEPFNDPFRRALNNFALNPDLARKIKAHNFGLSAASDVLDVTSSPHGTIGTSIRGAGDGVAEQIRLESASGVIAKIVKSCSQNGSSLVLKMDCEGSEFSIIDNLSSNDLLKHIDIIVMEWHKWWSDKLTQADLIRPMLKHDFAVFDRTSVMNPHAGMILAVRRTG